MSIDNDAKSPLAARLIELDDAWTNQSMDSKILIEPLSVLVGLGQKDVQPWPVKYVPTGLNEWKLESVFDRLAKRANSAGQSEELVKKIIGSNEAAAGSPEALAKDDATKAIMVALTWLRNDRGDKAVDFLKAIESAQLGSVHRTLVLQTLLAGLEDKACRRTVAQLGLGWAILNKPTERYAEVAPFDRLALEIVRKAIQNGMNKELRSSAIATYLELCRVDNDRYEGSSRSFRSVPQLEEIIKLYLTKGDNANALLYLGQRQAILSQGSDRDEDWLGSWLLENIQSKSNRLEAYQLLAEWTFQGDASLLNIAAFSRRARLPEWIPESIGGSYPNFAPIADKTVPLVTSFYSLALLAEEVQQSDALIARYEAARQQKRARASVGLAITLAALKRPVPEELLKELSDGLVAIRPVENVIQARVAAPLPELNLALILNSRREHADWARETVKEVERHGVPVNRAFLTPWLTHYSYQQGWSEQKSLQPADDLKHWSLGTMAPAKDYYEGKTPSIWLTDDQGQVVHLCGFGSDWMCWRYPLTGNFEFEFETEHSNRREIEFYAGGLRFAAYDTYVDITTEDSRDWLRVSTAIVKKNEWNKHSVTFDDKEMKYSINGKLIYNEPRLPGPVTVALRSLGTKLTVCRNVKFTGQPKLVPSMPLLSGDHLRGWSGTYYGANLPSSKFNTSPREGRQDLRTGSVSNDKANLRWTIENDELISGAGKGTGPENQSVIQYHRPMSAGDKVEYEFYYEPGKFEVHPSLGRTAYLVLPEGIQRHWMTEANTSWKTPAGNRFAIEGAQASALQAGQWNKAAIEIHSDRVLISINGQVALELPWKPDVNQACFGLFHVEGQSQVRVRNITLTGSWPTQMPENLFAR